MLRNYEGLDHQEVANVMYSLALMTYDANYSQDMFRFCLDVPEDRIELYLRESSLDDSSSLVKSDYKIATNWGKFILMTALKP